MGCKQIVKLTSDLLTFPLRVGIMNTSSRNACDPGNIFPLLSLYHTGKRAAIRLPAFLFFHFFPHKAFY